MNELLKTLTFVAVALLLTGAAFVSTRDVRKNQQFSDQGEPFFPDFQDPLACTDLEVVSFDPSTASTSRFRVMYKDKKWVIPSHNDYPADAKDRLSKTAAAVMDLKKDTIRSDDVKEQEAMGVIDPLDAKIMNMQGRGKRVIFRDSSDNVLVDFIIGKEIKGADRKEGASLYYVRVPTQKRTYGVNVKADLSTRFADWIETNLLKLDTGKVRRIVFDHYKLQEARDEQGSYLKRVPGEKTTIERKDSTGPWSKVTIERPQPDGKVATTGLPPDKEVNEDMMRPIIDALGDLKIVGVRPKPLGLKDPNEPGKEILEQIKLVQKMDRTQLTPELLQKVKLIQTVQASLRNKGFFLLLEGLFTDQGDIVVTTEDGIVYTLRYGGPVFATGEELTAGTPDTVEAKVEEKKDAPKKSEGTQESRFLMVTASFDPTIIPKPEKESEKPASKPADPTALPDDPFAPDPNDPKYIADQKAAEEKAKRDQADYEKKIADGQKRVKQLADRFGPWYYVTPVESFNQINIEPSVLIKPKGPAGASPTAPGPGGFQGGFPGPFPQDHP